VNAAVAGDEVVVTNGIYGTGGRAVGTNLLVNRVAVDKPLTVRSVKGPQFTLIQGYQEPSWTNGDSAIRCVYLTNGASLIGFTVANGATRWSFNDPTFADSNGGGVWCESWNAMISNCVVSGNSAAESGGGAYRGTFYNCNFEGNVANGRTDNGGGGAYGSTLYNCTLAWNRAGDGGGGAYRSTLYNCTLAGNRSEIGAGAYSCSLYNCIVINNSAWSWGGGGALCGFYNCTVTGNSSVNSGGGVGESWLFNSIVYYNSATSGDPDWVSCGGNNSCTTGVLGLFNSANNITNPPLFAAYLRLRSDSPCINAGDNALAGGPTDFGGSPRIAGGTVDMGAYEFQTPASAISYAWLQQYGLPINTSTDYADPDGDGMNNWQEWRADTIPTNALSALRMVTVTNRMPGLQVTWLSVPTRSYWLERATNVALPPSFSSIASNLAGQLGTSTYADLAATNGGPFFYRVGVLPSP
jgi:hypothetical protein